MIQLNLLPDVKTKYIKTESTKHLVFLSSIIVSIVALGIVIVLGSVVYGAQKIRLSSLNNSIKSNTSKLQQVDSLGKILTIQNQLNSLTSLHAQKPVTSRLFGFLPQITPNNVEISSLDLSLANSTIQFTGTADSIQSVNTFVDTLKFTTYTTDQSQTQTKAFSQVVLTSFSIGDKDTSYTINMSFDPTIFSSSSKTITLTVPKITSTRSQTEQPGALFQMPVNTKTGAAQ